MSGDGFMTDSWFSSKRHHLIVKDNLKIRILKKASVLYSKPEYIVRGSHASETASYVSIQCQNNSTIRALWRAFESAPLTMESPRPLSPPFHCLPTLTLQRIQLWLERPLSFQSLQSFDHNEFQSLSPPTLCSHLTSYKEESAEWREGACEAFIDRSIRQENHSQKIRLEKVTEWK